jgi:transcription elongation factor SPT6
MIIDMITSKPLKRKIDSPEGDQPAKILKSDTVLDDDEEDDEEDEDEDGYEEDDFLVKEEDDASLGDLEVDQELDSKRAKRHKKLKKNTKTFVLDEDDQLLIQETLNSNQPKQQVQNSGDYENAEIEPNAVDDESDVDDFIEDDGFIVRSPQESSFKDARRGPTKKLMRSRREGPSYDQIQEARDIFGDGYDEIGDDNYQEGEYDESGDFPSFFEVQKKPVPDLRTMNYEYIQLVQNFCLDEDEEIRANDLPERYQLLFRVRKPPSMEEIKTEAKWIVSILSEGGGDSFFLLSTIEAVLKFILVSISLSILIFRLRFIFLHLD